MARVSIVVPCLNRKEALKETLDAILAQGYHDFELLITDDGSTDGSGLFVLSYLGPDPARADKVWRDSLNPECGTRSIQMCRGGVLIRYLFHSSLKGAAAARNRAICAANGELLAFAEPGDRWHTSKLQQQVQILDASPSMHALLDGSGPRQPKLSPAKRKTACQPVEFEEALNPPGLSVSGSIVRRSALDWEGPFDENLAACDDYDFWLRLAARFTISRLPGSLQERTFAPAPSLWSIDRYRVYSMEKAFQSGHLDAMQRHRVAEVLIDRCARLSQGYRQRENVERANFYERKRKRFVSEVTKLDLSDPMFVGGRRERRLTTAPA